MMAGSHVILGLAAWAWMAPRFGLSPTAPASLAVAGLGALLPDIDHPQSWLGRRLRFVSAPLSSMVSHRGVTHSLLAVAVCLIFLPEHGQFGPVRSPLLVGYLSHLGADLLTPRGLRLTWPSRHVYALPLCRTGSATETALVGLTLAWTCLHLLHVRLSWM